MIVKCWTRVLDYASTYRNGGVGKSGEMTCKKCFMAGL